MQRSTLLPCANGASAAASTHAQFAAGAAGFSARGRLGAGETPPDDVALIAGLLEILPAAAMGTSAVAAGVLWTRFLKFDAADPAWPDRDRCILAVEHSADLLRALRTLTDQMVEAASPAEIVQPGHGFGTVVGMALAERVLAARFGSSLVDHRTWLLAAGPDMAQGVSHEAASLAGQFGLAKLTVVWDEGTQTDAAETIGILRRFAGYGWATRRVEGGDWRQLAAAFGMALRSRKPTLIACDGEPVRAAFGAADEAAEAARHWRAAGARGAAPRRAWLKRLAHHGGRAEFGRTMAGLLPDTLAAALDEAKAALGTAGGRMTAKAASDRVMETLAPIMPELVGGSAGPVAADGAAAGAFARRFLHFGTREHGMAAAMNGMAAHGGVLPYGGTSWALADSLRPALRFAAAMRSRVVHVLTSDGLGRGLEQLASLRAVPNLRVLRPADPIETAECWQLALSREDGPSLLVLDGDESPALRGVDNAGNRCAGGAYVLAEADGPRRATLIATGAEVALAMAARTRLAAERIAVAVVSLPCWDLFARASAPYRDAVLGDARRFGIEAGSGFGWERWLGAGGVFVGGEDGLPTTDFTPEAIAALVRDALAQA